MKCFREHLCFQGGSFQHPIYDGQFGLHAYLKIYVRTSMWPETRSKTGTNFKEEKWLPYRNIGLFQSSRGFLLWFSDVDFPQAVITSQSTTDVFGAIGSIGWHGPGGRTTLTIAWIRCSTISCSGPSQGWKIPTLQASEGKEAACRMWCILPLISIEAH